jgi:hypothetical protein
LRVTPTYIFSLPALGIIAFLLSLTYIRFMPAKILRALQLVFSKTTFLILVALAVVYSLWSINLSLQRLVVRYDETRLLAARMTGLERDMRELGMTGKQFRRLIKTERRRQKAMRVRPK